MYVHHQLNAETFYRLTAIPGGLFRLTLRILRFGLVATTPFLLFILAMAGCLLVLLPAAEEPTANANSSLLSQPAEVPKGPGRYIHITGRIRLSPGSAFTPSPDAPFVPIEFWYNEKAELNWCVKTPGALAYSSREASAIFLKDPHSDGLVAQPHYSVSYSQVPFVGHLMWGRELFPLEGSIARCRNSAVTSANCKNSRGHQLLRVSILPTRPAFTPSDDNDLSATWFDPGYAKTYLVDAANLDLLKARVSTFVNGSEVVLFETDTVTYTSTPQPPESLSTALDYALATAATDPTTAD